MIQLLTPFIKVYCWIEVWIWRGSLFTIWLIRLRTARIRLGNRITELRIWRLRRVNAALQRKIQEATK